MPIHQYVILNPESSDSDSGMNASVSKGAVMHALTYAVAADWDNRFPRIAPFGF
jgi:hypothetical protein